MSTCSKIWPPRPICGRHIGCTISLSTHRPPLHSMSRYSFAIAYGQYAGTFILWLSPQLCSSSLLLRQVWRYDLYISLMHQHTECMDRLFSHLWICRSRSLGVCFPSFHIRLSLIVILVAVHLGAAMCGDSLLTGGIVFYLLVRIQFLPLAPINPTLQRRSKVVLPRGETAHMVHALLCLTIQVCISPSHVPFRRLITAVCGPSGSVWIYQLRCCRAVKPRRGLGAPGDAALGDR